MIDERVRIGVAIRNPAVRFRLNGQFAFFDRSGSREVHSPGVEWSVTALEPSKTPAWSARLHTFIERRDALKLASLLKKYGVDARIAEMGKPAAWGRAGALSTSTWAVLAGQDRDADSLLRDTREALADLPPLADAPRGWKLFPDQWMHFDLVRLAPPDGGRLRLEGESGSALEVDSSLRVEPQDPASYFEIEGVRIGVDFHWDHRESLGFRGCLELIADGANVTAVNELDLEGYLASVLGSEMRTDWPVEALTAQAVAARSTVLATRGRHHFNEAFDLCHDDHCQDYQGLSREGEAAKSALEASRNWLLAVDGRVVDARFSKICGGVTEAFSTAWDEDHVPCLDPVFCAVEPPPSLSQAPRGHGQDVGKQLLDRLLAERPSWAACNPEFSPYPESVTEMAGLYRWRRELTPEHLQELIATRIGDHLGGVSELVPLGYGASGRIKYLRVMGERGTATVGKELAIRRLLSDTHLPSSAFSISRGDRGIWVFEGIGWGHGVGLCQMGAAGLAKKGWHARDILLHYYPGASIVER